jgi:hypothetical protein
MGEAMVTTTVRISRKVWLLLRLLAEQRALEVGGKASVSGIVSAMAEEKAAAKVDRRA